MIENLKRSRETLSWILMGLVLVSMALTGWRFAMALGEMAPVAAFQEVGGQWMNFAISFVLVLVVMSCSWAAPATRHAHLITRLAAVLLTLGVLLTLISALMGMWASAAGIGVVLDVLGGLLDVALKAVLAGSLWVFLRGVKAGRIETAPPSQPAPTEAPEPSADGAADPAAATVWWTAADAATGAPGHDRMPPSEAVEDTLAAPEERS
jgi:hypothetical protein